LPQFKAFFEHCRFVGLKHNANLYFDTGARISLPAYDGSIVRSEKPYNRAMRNLRALSEHIILHAMKCIDKFQSEI
jgi:hypothetical protein